VDRDRTLTIVGCHRSHKEFQCSGGAQVVKYVAVNGGVMEPNEIAEGTGV
jgi:hypothetical protein